MLLRELYYLYKTVHQLEKNREKTQIMLFNSLIPYLQDNPFYSNYYKKYGKTIQKITSTSDISTFPCITKKTLLENYPLLFNKKLDLSNKIDTTSGTTEKKFEVILAEETIDYTNCIFSRSLKKQQFHPLSTSLFYWYRSEEHSFFNKFGIFKKIYFNYAYTPEQIYSLVKKHNIKNIYIFPWKLFEFFNSFSAKEIFSLNLKSISIIGEHTPKSLIQFLQTKTHASIYVNYGLTEFNIVAFKKSSDYAFIINHAITFVEIEGSEFFNIKKLILTSFSNIAMPFVRYDIDDYVITDKKNNILEIIGKKENIIFINKKIYLLDDFVKVVLSHTDWIHLFSFEIEKNNLHIQIVIKKKNKSSVLISDFKKLYPDLKVTITLTKKLLFDKRGKFKIIENNYFSQ